MIGVFSGASAAVSTSGDRQRPSSAAVGTAAEVERVQRHYAQLHRTLQRAVEERLARKEAETEMETEPETEADTETKLSDKDISCTDTENNTYQ